MAAKREQVTHVGMTVKLTSIAEEQVQALSKRDFSKVGEALDLFGAFSENWPGLLPRISIFRKEGGFLGRPSWKASCLPHALVGAAWE